MDMVIEEAGKFQQLHASSRRPRRSYGESPKADF